MPIYEYQCHACDARVEFLQKFKEAPKRKCPECGALRLKKLVSAAAFHLKGGGWYVTDFKNSKKAGGQDEGQDKGKDKSADKDTGTGGDTGTKENQSSSTAGADKKASPSKSGAKQKRDAKPSGASSASSAD